MKIKLLRIIRANFDVEHGHDLKCSIVYRKGKRTPMFKGDVCFDLIVKMLECIYPQGRHYAIMRHSRRFKQARRKEVAGVMEIACVVGFVALIVIAILNSCCGSGDQY